MQMIQLLPVAAVTALVACGGGPTSPDTPEATGSLHVTLVTTGPGAPTTSLQLTVGDRAPVAIDPNGAADVTGLSVGSTTVRLDIPGRCLADHHAPRAATVATDAPATLSWSIRCPAAVAPGIIATHYGTPNDGVVWLTDAQASSGSPIGGPPGISGILPTLNPARTLVAYLSDEDHLVIAAVDGSKTITTSLTGILDIDWSPDGTRLLVVHDRQYPEGGMLSVVWPDGVVERTVRSAAVEVGRWAPDGHRIAYGEGAYIYVEDLDTGARTNTGHLRVKSGTGLAWSPDGSHLAYVDLHTESIYVMRPDGSDRQTVATLPSDLSTTGRIDWSDGDQLLILLPANPLTPRLVPYVVPSAGGTPVMLHDDGAYYEWARWVDP